MVTESSLSETLGAILDRHDRRRAALHEAAHAVMARYVGGSARPRIWRTAAGRWDGACRIYPPSKGRHPPRNWRRLVGLSGWVAEQIFEGATADDLPLAFIEAASIFDPHLSAGDLSMIGRRDWFDKPIDATLAEVFRILRARWPAVELIADRIAMEAQAE